MPCENNKHEYNVLDQELKILQCKRCLAMFKMDGDGFLASYDPFSSEEEEKEESRDNPDSW